MNPTTPPNKLRFILLLAGLTSLIHFSHNALFVDSYPNFPSQISGGAVLGAWAGSALIGGIGFLLVQRNQRVIGLLLLAAFASLGISGLGHYSLAPIAAHTLTMNITIWLEAGSGVIALILVIGLMFQARQK